MVDVVMLLGRGVEGCGVTKFTVEMSKYLKRRGKTFTVVALKDKMWSRKDSHVVENLQQFKFAKDEEFAVAKEICDNAGVVIVNSLPSLQVKVTAKAHDVHAVENFMTLIEECKAPLVMIQHDHNKLSLRRNAGTDLLIKKAALLLAHSDKGDFAEQVAKTTGTAGALAFVAGAKKKIKTFQPAFNFNDHRDRYWRPNDEQDEKLVRWVGRTTFWKGFVPMFDFHNNYLRDSGFATVLEGIEKSPAYLDFKTKSVYFDMLDNKDPNTVDMKEYRGKDSVVFSVYNNDAMLKRMAKTGFGAQLSLLAPKFIDKSIEYTHCEIAAVGAVPIFRKEFGDYCYHRKLGKPLTKCLDSGTIWLPTDKKDMGLAAYEINRVACDSGLREEYRNRAFEFYRDHQDADGVFDDIFKEIDDAIYYSKLETIARQLPRG